MIPNSPKCIGQLLQGNGEIVLPYIDDIQFDSTAAIKMDRG